MLGERIKRARRAAGLSLREAGEKAGLSHTAISKFEKGQATPTSKSLIQLARAFGVRTEFFLRPETLSLGRPEFRKQASLPKKAQVRVEADILDQVERFADLLAAFPQRPIAEFAVPDEVPAFFRTLDEVEGAAEAVRRAWFLGLNAIPRLAETLEERGLLVLATEADDTGKFDGLTATVKDLPVVVVNAHRPGDRQRFTMAHELGHLVLDGRLADDLDEEKACHRFAGAFLVPGPTARAELGTHRTWLDPRELELLKHEYGLSMGAWISRASDQGIISTVTKEKLHRYFSKQGWRKAEPGAPVPPETPQLFERLVFHALSEDLIATSKAAELMGQSVTAFQRRLRFEDEGVPAHQ
jgi:Zn-dependent peptidase ImmA (M78 family)